MVCPRLSRGSLSQVPGQSRYPGPGMQVPGPRQQRSLAGPRHPQGALDADALCILPGGNIEEPNGSDGMVFSSHRLLGNIRNAALAWGKIPLCVDGTYKLHNGNWVLIILLTITVRKGEGGNIVTSARPIAFNFTQSESAALFSKLFKAVQAAGRRGRRPPPTRGCAPQNLQLAESDSADPTDLVLRILPNLIPPNLILQNRALKALQEWGS